MMIVYAIDIAPSDVIIWFDHAGTDCTGFGFILIKFLSFSS